jgi:stalled ribosome rescue protein Dom34
MLNYVIWLNSEKAHIFAFNNSGMERLHLQRNGEYYSINEKGRYGDNANNNFFPNLVEKLKNAHQLLILGPGFTKDRFREHIEVHHSGNLAKKIVGTEMSSHPTDIQVAEAARKFFKNIDLFGNSTGAS